MEIINSILGVPLGYILYWCYQLVGSFGLAILLFTLATKLILFPLSLIAQKNAITMVRIKPQLDDVKRRYEGNNTLMLEEQKKLYKKEHYSTIRGVLPLLFQIPLILGLIYVIYNPLQHMLHMDPATIKMLVDQASVYLGIPVPEMGFAAQLKVMELAQTNPDVFMDLPDATNYIEQIQSIDMSFLGVNLSQNPSFSFPAIFYPILSGLSALALSLYQNRYYVLQKVASRLSKWGMTIFLVAFSGYFAAVLPMGLGLYWTVGNVLSIVVVWLCNCIYNPKRLLDWSLLAGDPELSKEQKAQARALKSRQKKLEKKDFSRFAKSGSKELVFYSEASGFYKYYEEIITWLLNNSSLVIHYVTSDVDDQVFELASPRLRVYYIGPKKLITFMMRLDADMAIMSMPDLEKYHIKRSLIRKDTEYIYLDHGFGSVNLMLREGALDGFNTIFCYGQSMVDEIRALEYEYDLPEKRLVATGFSLYDVMVKRFEERIAEHSGEKEKQNTDPIILLAPSWQPDNILESCFEETVRPLLNQGYRVVVRPHPEFVKRFSNKINALLATYQGELTASDGNLPQLTFELDFSSNETVYSADIVITDWSSIAQEFSLGTKRPSIFVNTPMKVMNPNWQRIDVTPIDLELREQLGVALEIDELNTIGEVADTLIKERSRYRIAITEAYERNIFNIGWAERAAGEYIVASLQFARAERKKTAYKSQKPAGDKK